MIPNFWIAEFFVNLEPACDEIAVQPLTVKDSFVELPTDAGAWHRHRRGRGCKARPYRDMVAQARGCGRYWEEFPRKNYVAGADPTGY